MEQMWSPNGEGSLGVYLFTWESLPRGLKGLAARAWLDVTWGPLSPAGVSRSPSLLPSADAISMLVGSKVHTTATGGIPSTEPRACGLETDISSWWVSHIHLSETRVDGLMVAMTFSAVSGAILTLSVSSLCLSVPVVVSLSLSLALVLFASKLLVLHTRSPSVVLDTPLMAEAGLCGVGMVAQMEPSSWLPVPGATTPVAPGVCLPLAEAVVLLVPRVRATLSHPVPCLSIVCIVPGARLLAAGDTVTKDSVMSSPAATVAAGTALERPV